MILFPIIFDRIGIDKIEAPGPDQRNHDVSGADNLHVHANLTESRLDRLMIINSKAVLALHGNSDGGTFSSPQPVAWAKAQKQLHLAWIGHGTHIHLSGSYGRRIARLLVWISFGKLGCNVISHKEAARIPNK